VKSDLIREAVFGRSDLIRVKSDLIREAVFGRSDLIRVKSDLALIALIEIQT
jgi:hypothetical protein